MKNEYIYYQLFNYECLGVIFVFSLCLRALVAIVFMRLKGLKTPIVTFKTHK
jgi:hypothetical protein